jgi:hypothetical protein
LRLDAIATVLLAPVVLRIGTTLPITAVLLGSGLGIATANYGGMVTDGTTGRGTEQAVMARIVSGNTADGGTRQAADCAGCLWQGHRGCGGKQGKSDEGLHWRDLSGEESSART